MYNIMADDDLHGQDILNAYWFPLSHCVGEVLTYHNLVLYFVIVLTVK